MGAMQTRIIGVVVAAIVILGGTAFFLHSRSSKPQQATSSPTTTASPQANSVQQTIADLFTMGGNKKCTFSSGANTSGTFYVSGTSVRGDMTLKDSNGKIQTMHIIRMGDDNYIWGDAIPGGSGIKMKLTAQQFASNSQVQQSLNANQKTNFNCTNSNPDLSMFVVPTNVKFLDMTSVMQPSNSPAASNNPSSMQVQCAACNSLSGTSKTTCLAYYHCQ